MNYHDILHCDFNNSLDGVGVTLFVSGCKGHPNCKGCHNPQTWEYDSGKKFEEKDKIEIFNELNKRDVKVLTITGGDPLSPLNRPDILSLVKEVKEKYPDKKIWVYTGFLYEDVKDLEILKYIDVLVDGPFIEEKRDPTTCFIKGSSNQRVLRLYNGEIYEELD